MAFLEKLRWWDRNLDWLRARPTLFSSIERLMGAVSKETGAGIWKRPRHPRDLV